MSQELSSAPRNAIVRPPEAISQQDQVARVLWLRTLFGESISETVAASTPMEPLAGRMTEFFLPKGRELYLEDTASDSLYFIVEGTIEQGSTKLITFGSGDVLGFIDTTLERRHRFTARAATDAVILRLKADEWFDYLDEHVLALQGLIVSRLDIMQPRADTRHPDDDQELKILSQLSKDLPTSSGNFVRQVFAVRASPVLRRASIQAISQLVRRGASIELEAGEKVAGTVQPGLAIVTQGSVELSPRDESEFAAVTQHAGTLAHSLQTISDQPPKYHVQARSKAELLFVSRPLLFEIMEDHFDVARSLLAHIASELDLNNQQRDRREGRSLPPARGRNSLRPRP